MKIKNNKFFVSPSDLNNFVACKYTVLNEIKYHNKEIRKSPDRANDKLWKEMGVEHEKRHYKILKEKYKKRQNRKRKSASFRLERLFYEELGKERDFKHAHFYIKGTAKDENAKELEKQLIKDTLTENWKEFGTIQLRDNDNTLYASSYCYKETDTQANIGTFNHIISTVTPPQ